MVLGVNNLVMINFFFEIGWDGCVVYEGIYGSYYGIFVWVVGVD